MWKKRYNPIQKFNNSRVIGLTSKYCIHLEGNLQYRFISKISNVINLHSAPSLVFTISDSFIRPVFCLTTGPKHPPKRFRHIVPSRASSLKWHYPLLSLRSSSSFLRLLTRLLVTSISPSIFPSITCFRRQFLHKMWPTELAFRFLISCRIFLCSLTLSNTSSFLTWSHAYTVDHMCARFRLALDLQEHEYCISWGVSAGIKPAELLAGRSENILSAYDFYE